ncbi:MAG: DUF790 family protein [Deltaproteobacteria bacterium]|nr:DUF790 family protein [Deltaproteobacteria bacterium]
MLTADLVVARVSRGELRPRYVDPTDPGRLQLAADLVGIFQAQVGGSREALDGALAARLGDGTDFLLHRGLAKLLRDRSEFEVRAPCEPEALRRRLFEVAAEHHPAVPVADAVHTVTHAMVLERVAREFQIPQGGVLGAMYADLEDAQVLARAPETTARELLERYNVALAQAALLRATELTLRLRPATPQRCRQLFRYVRFFRLMHTVEGSSREGYTVRLDGPLSLFQASVKYGLQLAEFLPALLLCQDWEAEARVQWGPDRHPVTLRLRPSDGLVSHFPDKGSWLPQEIEWLLEKWPSLASPWTPSRQAQVLDLGGRGVLVPELTFQHPDGRTALVEVLGFWKKDYLHARLELLKDKGPKNLVLLLPWRLRAAEEEPGVLPGTTLVYKDVIPAKDLLARLEAVGVLPRKNGPEGRKNRAS